jgi:hypothetical protein
MFGASSAFADIGAGWVLRQQCGGLPTVAASSSETAGSCISELTLSTPCRRLTVVSPAVSSWLAALTRRLAFVKISGKSNTSSAAYQ